MPARSASTAAAAQAPRGERRRGDRGGARRAAGRAGGRAGGPRSRSPTRTSTCSSSTSPPAWSCTRPAVTAPARWPRRWPDGPPGARTPIARGSCTAWTAIPPGCSWWPSHDEVHRALKALLAARGLHREYLALVEGRPPARTGTIDAPIGRHRHERVLMSIDTDEPREARTHFEIERLLPRATLLRVVLDTGRTHQIRVHMAAIDHPVCGDPQYGTAGAYGLERQFLHAARPGLRASGDRRGRRRDARRCPRIWWPRWPAPEQPSRTAAVSKKRRGGPSKAAPPMMLANRPPEVGEGRFGSR